MSSRNSSSQRRPRAVRPKQRSTARRTVSRRSGPSVTAAPTSVGYVTTGPSVRFSSARSGSMNGVRLTFSQRWLTIKSGAAGSETKILLPNSGTHANSCAFDPNNSQAMSNPLHQLADCFARYRLHNLRLIYRPQAASTNTQGFAIGFFSDAEAAAYVTSYSLLTESQRGQAAVVWQPFAWSVPLENDFMRFMYTFSAGRLSDAGILIAYPNGTPTASTVFGELWIEGDISLFELANLSAVGDRKRAAQELKTAQTEQSREVKYSDYSKESKQDELQQLQQLDREHKDAPRNGLSQLALDATRPDDREMKDLRVMQNSGSALKRVEFPGLTPVNTPRNVDSQGDFVMVPKEGGLRSSRR